MPDIDLKIAIQQAIQQFEKKPLATAAIDLLETLGYQSEKRLVLTPNTSDQFKEEFDPYKHLNVDKAFLSEWSSVDLLFQITDEEIQGAMAGMSQLFVNQKVDNTIINSYLFFAVGLRGEQYTRTQLAAITREINKLFLMPVMVIFKHGQAMTIAIIARRLHKRDQSRDVLEKVTLIKNVAINQPHRAHVEILYDLSVERLSHVHGFSNFVELQRAWEKTLDTSELNKKFFREVANWYFWAVKNVTFPEGAGAEEETRNAISVIRLITRLIFSWFIKEKGLVPEDLFDERRLKELLNFNDPNQSTYYKAILQNLFFATLNTEMGEERKFRGENEKGRDQHYMVHNVYRYKRYFQDPGSAINMFAGIPFLNGGLFECLDRPDKDDPKNILRVDGFSDHEDNPLQVPDELFFGAERGIDLNDIYDTKNKKYKVRGLIHIFNSYKFTIEENTPIEEEIALDPELLGKVFENLLAAYNPETGTTARKQTGSFYTPREIVNYMVDESLIAFLESKLEGAENVQERLRHLLTYNDEKPHFNDSEIGCLIDTIDNIKVLDPACGSGAFPMGILHKLVYVLSKLDPYNSRWSELQLQKAIIDTEEAYRIGDHDERKIRLLDIEEIFNDNTSDYGRKLYLIENCIYGVDIQPIAVQIAKLRFFISLVVDQRVDWIKENIGIRPLPNLETKLVTANTLIAIEGPKTGKETKISFGDHLISDKRFELQQIRHKHFRDRTFKSKEKHREQDKQLRAEISELLKKNGWGSTAAAQLTGWDPYDQNARAGFFDPEWMFGIEGGFDVVIGNPPYLRVQGIQKTQGEFVDYYRKHFESATGGFDLYALFIEKGYKLLDKGGQLAYIVPHKFLQASFGTGLRRMLTERQALRQLVRFGHEQIFEESTTYTCLLFLATRPNREFDLIEIKSLERGEEVLQAVRAREEYPDYAYDTLPEPSLSEKSPNENVDWDFAIGEKNRVLRRLQQHPKRLENIIRKMFQGIPTGADKVFVLELIRESPKLVTCYSNALNNEIEIEKDFVKPFLMGKDVHRYEKPQARNVVLFPYTIINNSPVLMSQTNIEKNFPKAWTYLKKNELTLKAREGGRFTASWHCYSRPQNLTEFENIKLITPEIANSPQMTFDSDGILYHTTKVYSFAFKDPKRISLKFMLGVLNSKVLWFFLTSTGYVLRGGYYTFKTEYLKPFPVAEAIPKQERIIENLVNYVLTLKALPAPANSEQKVDRRLMVAYFEQLIDGLVYELYFPEEFNDAGKSLFKLLPPSELPAMEELKEAPEHAIQDIFRKLYDIQHPVRQMVFFLDTIEAVRVIEGKIKGA